MIEARAVKIAGKGEVDVLSLGTLLVRDPGAGEVRVQVKAAGLNRADTLQRRGHYPAPPGVPSDVPGLEYAGVIESVGDDVHGVAVGDAVMGIVAGGAMATHLITHSRELLRVPSGMSMSDAAAIPEAFLTAYDAVILQARLGLGSTLLVHSVGSGVGTAALQLGLSIGARVLGSSRTQDKLDRCAALGLRDALLVPDKVFASEVLQRTAQRGCDVILDAVGAAYLAENVKSLALQGRLVIIGMMGGATAELPLGALLAKRASLIGTVLRSRPLEEKAALAQAFVHDVLPLFESGKLKPVIDGVLPMSEIRAAHQRIEKNQSFGKLVLTWD